MSGSVSAQGGEGPFTSIRALNTVPQANLDQLTALGASVSDAHLSTLLTNEWIGVPVRIRAVVLSDPRYSGLASINAGTGLPGRLHFWVRDLASETEGVEGMTIQVVDAANVPGTLALRVGDIVEIDGAVSVFTSGPQRLWQFEPLGPSSIVVTGSVPADDPILAPVLVTTDDINRSLGGGVQARWDRWNSLSGQYVRVEDAVVTRSAQSNRPNWAVSSSGQASFVANYDVSLRYRNDRTNYPSPPFFTRPADDPFIAPAIGATVVVQGFLAFGLFDAFELGVPPRVKFYLAPMADTDLQPWEPPSYTVTFSVDMSVQVATGAFDPDTDAVFVTGAPWDWVVDANPLALDPVGGWVYSGTFAADLEAPSMNPYKFIQIDGGETVTWESGENRLFSVTGTEPDGAVQVPLRYFDDVLPEDVLTDSAEITYVVDLRPAYYFLADNGFLPTSDGEGLHSIDGLFLNGPAASNANEDSSPDWLTWGPGGLGLAETRRLWDDGIVPDEAAGDSLFTIRYTYSAGTTRQLFGKFGVNGTDSEAGFGQDHAFRINEGAQQIEVAFGCVRQPDGTFVADQGPGGFSYASYLVVDNEAAVPTCSVRPRVDEPQITVRQLNALPASTVGQLLALGSDASFEQVAGLLTNEWVGVPVQIRVAVLSDPRYSGFASWNASLGRPGRLHFWVRDVAAAEQGPEGMTIQVVDESGESLALRVGDIVEMEGAVSVFQGQWQFSPAAFSVVGTVEPGSALLEPVSVTTAELNQMAMGGGAQANWANWNSLAGQYVRIEAAEVTDSIQDLRPNWAFRSSPGAARVAARDVSLRYRNDRVGTYPDPPYFVRSADDPFLAPTVGEAIRVQGFVAFGGFDAFSIGQPPQAVFQLAPITDDDLERVSESECVLSWSALLTADAQNGGMTTLGFGQGPTATDGIDEVCGELELPPPPPAFEARFILPDGQTGSYRDYRNDSATLPTWRIQLAGAASNYPVAFTWDPEALPAGRAFFLRDVVTGGALVNVDLRSGGSFVLQNAGLTALDIVEAEATQTVSVPLAADWNLLSVPVTVPDAQAGSVYPGASSHFFGFSEGYVIAETLQSGKGYWARFDEAAVVEVSGQRVEPQAVALTAGWNLIGFFEQALETSTLVSTPGGLIESNFFAYDDGYDAVTTLEPGRGFWVRAASAGVLTVASALQAGDAAIAETLAEQLAGEPEAAALTVTDAAGRSISLRFVADASGAAYVLPPVPPVGAYDVRFADDRSAGTLADGAWTALLAGAELPVQLRLEGLEGALRLRDTATGSLFDVVLESGEVATLEVPVSSLAMEYLALSASEEGATAFALEAAYPNPAFGSDTRIGFVVPEGGAVRLTVYDVLGRAVLTLVDGEVTAGRHEVVVSAGSLASGTYLYRLEAEGASATRRFVVTR